MSESIQMQIIARLHTDFPTKFGIPRQSSLVKSLRSTLVFEPEFRNPDALRGLEGFSHVWLLWQFSAAVQDSWSPTVRPPRLGGNTRMGVFATRSPFRPNAIGLSAVELAGIEPDTPQGPVLHLLGADLMDGTPILDIKPYLPYADAYPDARGGFAAQAPQQTLQVEFPPALLAQIPADRRESLLAVLAQDPRPRYQNAPDRVYGMAFAGFDVRFTVTDDILRVCGVVPLAK